MECTVAERGGGCWAWWSAPAGRTDWQSVLPAGANRASLLRTDFLLAHQVLDLFELVAHEEHVGQVEGAGTGPRGVDVQVARSQPEYPVAEQVVPLLLHEHARRIVRLLA